MRQHFFFLFLLNGFRQSLSSLRLHAWGFLQTPAFESSIFYPYMRQHGKVYWETSSIARLLYSDQPRELLMVTRVSQQSQSPDRSTMMRQIAAKARKSVSSSVWINPGTKHRHGISVSSALEPRWKPCLFLLPCAGANHCNPAGGGKSRKGLQTLKNCYLKPQGIILTACACLRWFSMLSLVPIYCPGYTAVFLVIFNLVNYSLPWPSHRKSVRTRLETQLYQK